MGTCSSAPAAKGGITIQVSQKGNHAAEVAQRYAVGAKTKPTTGISGGAADDDIVYGEVRRLLHN